MQTTKVVIEPYNKMWRSAFEETKKEIEDAIGDLIIGIERVGSASVEENGPDRYHSGCGKNASCRHY